MSEPETPRDVAAERGVGRPVPERAEVAERLAQAWARHLGTDPSQFTPSARLVADLHFDDLDCIDALMAAEDEFDLVIEYQDANACMTVDDYVSLVLRLLDSPACANYEPPNVPMSRARDTTAEARDAVAPRLDGQVKPL